MLDTRLIINLIRHIHIQISILDMQTIVIIIREPCSADMSSREDDIVG